MAPPGAFGTDRALFDVPPEIAYFNTANLSPHLHAVREAGEAALRKRGRPWTISAQDWFTDVERSGRRDWRGELRQDQ
jgi:hypothetical protein